MSGKKQYLIDEDTLKDLLTAAHYYAILERDGVDNWEWYGASLGDFLEAWIAESGLDPDSDWDFTSMAEEDLNNYASCEF